MVGGSLLKNRGLIERPLPGFRLRPVGVLPEKREDVAIIGLVVGPEVEGRPFARAGGYGCEKLLGHDPVLVVATLRPGIGEQDEDSREPRPLGHHGEKVSGIAADKMEVPEARAIPLAVGTGDAVRGDVDSYAGLARMSVCIGGEKMAVPAAHLPDELGRGFEEIGKSTAQLVAPF